MTNININNMSKYRPDSNSLRLIKQQSMSSLMNTNYQNNIKDLSAKLKRKEESLQALNSKITKLVLDLQNKDEEIKKYNNLIEKEESEGERLRHFLNFLTYKINV